MAMRTVVLAAIWLTMLAGSGAQAAGMFLLPNGATVYNSGINLSATLDQSYIMTLNPYNPGSGDAFLQGAGYLSGNNSDSGWLTPAGTGTHAPELEYRIETIIDLNGIDPATIVFDGYWVSDNQGLDILVNGNSTGQTNTGSHLDLPSAFPGNAFTLTQAQGLAAGENTISFNWGNGPAGNAASQFPNPVHVRVEFTGYTLVPLPAAASLFVPAGVWLLGRRRAETGA